MSPDRNQLELLRRPFPPKLIGKLPRTSKRPALDYVGHAAVTDRLIAADPEWSFSIDHEFTYANEWWIRGTMVVGGVARPEYGHGKDPLEAVSHFIRRAAMRFGVALDLWSKEELIEASASSSPAQPMEPVTSGRDGDAERGGGETLGEGVTPPPLTTPSAQPDGHHEHDWKPSPNLKNWRYCTVKGCGRAERIPEGANA